LREWLRPALEFSVLAVGVAATWYLKRWVETGNPFFPLWYGVLGGRDWSPELQAPFERGMFYWYGMRKTWWTFVWSPWAMTMAG
jgi:hypothetical protein